MYRYAEKTQGREKPSADKAPESEGCDSALPLLGQRPEAVVQARLQELANDSPRVKQLKTFQEMAEKSPQARLTAQRQAAAQAGTVQGVFTYGPDTVDSAAAANELGERLYNQFVESGGQPKLSKEQFIGAVTELAELGDHGPLGDEYFFRLLAEGQIRESFTFQVNERRIDTKIDEQANFPPQRSFFHQRLEPADAKPDLSYNDLRNILEQTLGGGLSQNEIDAAIWEGVQRFDHAQAQIGLDPRMNIDLQLIPQHLLRYQSHNRGPLRDTPENDDENAFRQLVTELSKYMIQRAGSRLDRIVPPTADTREGGALYDALPALIDVNRPLANSVFDQETYKAVFKITYNLLRKAWDALGAARTEGTVEARIQGVRGRMNSSFFRQIPEMEGSTVPSERGKEYVTKRLRLPYDEEQQSFDERSSSSGESGTDEEMYDEGDHLFRASQKRQTALNTMGTFVKMESQKELIDEDSEKNRRKFSRIRRGILKRTGKIDSRYGTRYANIAKEVAFYERKAELIERRRLVLEGEEALIQEILTSDTIFNAKEKLRSLSKGSVFYKDAQEFLSEHPERANSKKFKEGLSGWIEKLRKRADLLALQKRQIGLSLRRLRRVQESLEEFYWSTPVGDILDKMKADPRTWRRDHPESFGNLGEKALESIALNPFRVPLQDRATVAGRTYATNQPGIRDGGQCFWDTLRVRYGFSAEHLQAAAQDAGVAFDQAMNVDQIETFVEALAGHSGRQIRIVLDIFNLANLGYLDTREYGSGGERIRIGLFWMEQDLNGHFVPPAL